MYCKNCGAEVEEGSRVCPSCGALIDVELKEEVVAEVKQPAKVWLVFEKLAHIFGIVGIICACTVVLSPVTFEVSVIGLVFAILSKKVGKVEGRNKGSIVKNAVALGIAFVAFIILEIIVISSGLIAEGM